MLFMYRNDRSRLSIRECECVGREGKREREGGMRERNIGVD